MSLLIAMAHLLLPSPADYKHRALDVNIWSNASAKVVEFVFSALNLAPESEKQHQLVLL